MYQQDLLPSFHEGEREPGPKNLQIQSLFDEIVNDDHDMDVAPTVMKQESSTTTTQAIPKQFSIIPTTPTTPQTIPPLRKSFMPPMKVLPSQKKMLPPTEVIAAIFPSFLKSLKPQSKVRSKEDIMGYSDESSEEESSDDVEEPDDSSI